MKDKKLTNKKNGNSRNFFMWIRVGICHWRTHYHFNPRHRNEMTNEQYLQIEKRITKYAQEASTTEVRLAYAHSLSVFKDYLTTETFNANEK